VELDLRGYPKKGAKRTEVEASTSFSRLPSCFCPTGLYVLNNTPAHTHIHMHAHTYTHTYIHTRTYTHAHTHTDIHRQMFTHSHGHVHTHTRTHMHPLSLPTPPPTPAHTHTHTHAHKHTQTQIERASDLGPRRESHLKTGTYVSTCTHTCQMSHIRIHFSFIRMTCLIRGRYSYLIRGRYSYLISVCDMLHSYV